MSSTVKIYEFHNTCHENRDIIDAFLRKNYFVRLDWADRRLVYLILTDENDKMIGVSAMAPQPEARRAEEPQALAAGNENNIHVQVIALAKKWQGRGIGTEILKHISSMYSDREVTFDVRFSESKLLGFYCRKKYARIKRLDAQKQVVVMELVHHRILHDIPLPE